jgi:hypothetical protein
MATVLSLLAAIQDHMEPDLFGPEVTPLGPQLPPDNGMLVLILSLLVLGLALWILRKS